MLKFHFISHERSNYSQIVWYTNGIFLTTLNVTVCRHLHDQRKIISQLAHFQHQNVQNIYIILQFLAKLDGNFTFFSSHPSTHNVLYKNSVHFSPACGFNQKGDGLNREGKLLREKKVTCNVLC